MAIAVPDLRDDTVVLRLPTERDVDAITEACQDPLISQFTRVPSPYTRANAVEFVRQASKIRPSGTEVTFVITDATDDTVLGATGIMNITKARDVAEIGYWVAREARGNRIATRAARLVSRWAVLELGIKRLELVAHVDNVASQAVAEHVGFTREGILRDYATMGRGISDVVMFSLLPRDLDERSP
jgi:RimJ/RimL family protein N-acetyltransferase